MFALISSSFPFCFPHLLNEKRGSLICLDTMVQWPCSWIHGVGEWSFSLFAIVFLLFLYSLAQKKMSEVCHLDKPIYHICLKVSGEKKLEKEVQSEAQLLEPLSRQVMLSLRQSSIHLIPSSSRADVCADPFSCHILTLRPPVNVQVFHLYT